MIERLNSRRRWLGRRPATTPAAARRRYRHLLDRSLDARIRDELDVIVDRRHSDR